MLKKVIKRGHRKPSKSESNDPSLFGYGPPKTRTSGLVSTANVVVNHTSLTGPAATLGPNSGGPNAMLPIALTEKMTEVLAVDGIGVEVAESVLIEK